MRYPQERNEQTGLIRAPSARSISVIITILLAAVAILMPPKIIAQGQPEIIWSKNSNASMTSVAYAPDGQTVFSGGQKVGNLWRASDGALLRSLSFGEIGCGTINRVADTF